jgi:hypothetical protein
MTPLLGEDLTDGGHGKSRETTPGIERRNRIGWCGEGCVSMVSRRRLVQGALALAGVLVTGAARAQDVSSVASESDPSGSALASRFVELRASGEWAKALGAYDELVAHSPALRKNARFTLDRVLCLRKLGQRAEASDTLEALLGDEPENIVAIYQLAALDLEEGSARKREDAKELLLLAARNGLAVLRELGTEKGTGFAALLKDPRFILATLHAQHEFDAGRELARGPVRNPFAVPAVGDFKEKLRRVPEVDTEQTRLARAIEAATRAAEQVRIEELRAAQLEHLVARGRECLAAMTVANRDDRWADALSQFERLGWVVSELEKVDREEFARAARALSARGEELRSAALKKKRIQELDLVVTGIVVDKRPEGRSRSVIVYDDPERRGRVYEAGDELRDRSDRRVEGLRVVEIRDGSVKFQYDDLEFVKEIKDARQ